MRVTFVRADNRFLMNSINANLNEDWELVNVAILSYYCFRLDSKEIR